jgi:hypothetical protein
MSAPHRGTRHAFHIWLMPVLEERLEVKPVLSEPSTGPNGAGILSADHLVHSWTVALVTADTAR